MLCRDGQAVDMSIDHKASDPEVADVVNTRGGFIANGRINGILGKFHIFSVFRIPL